MTDKTAPESQLRLEWVYGYRGNQCRNNLYYTDAQNVVYFVAAVGVVYNEEEKSQQFFLGHTDDITSLALHPEKRLVATGQIGKDPFICVWDSRTLNTESILQGEHQRGITALSFSGDGNLLASVGLDDHHTVVVWEWKKGRKLATARGHTDKVLDIQFNPYTSGTLVTCGVKHIKFWAHRGNMLTGKKGIFGTAGELQSVLCVTFASAEVTYAGTFSGHVYKWNENRLQTVIGAHSSAVYCMHHGNDGYATGSRDGTVKLWDVNFQPITTIDLTKTPAGYPGLCVRSVCWEGRQVLIGTKCSEILEVSTDSRDNPKMLAQGHAEGELWALAIHSSAGIFATGSDDQTIRLWDRKRHVILRRVSTTHAVRSLAFSPSDGAHLAAGMQDGSFIVYDSGTLAEVAHIKNRKEVLHEMKYSPDGQFLAVGSNDNFVDVYSIKDHYRHVCQCRGSTSFITHLDWSTDSHYIQTNSGAAERLFYKIPSGKQVTSKDEIQSIQWNTWTCVLGPETAGTWPKYSQTNDINATSASFQHQAIVTGDDFGLVKLFRFPSLRKGAKFRKYVGHSAHVTNVRFTNDDRHVISLGGADHAIFQWRFLPQGMEQAEAANEKQEYDHPLEITGDSDSEESDSDVSDVGSVDSDLANEQKMTYKRPIYREDLPELRKKLKKKADKEQSASGMSANRAAATGKKQSAPESGLTMQFVHGYRGYDCRNNLYYTQTGEVVYHIAAVGVVYNSANHTQRFYTRHTDDILCLNMHPTKDHVATGQIGRDPAIHVWDAETMETISILKGAHSRGICAVDFSGDGKKLASVGLDDDHSIVVWDWRKGYKVAETRGHKDKIFMLQWNPAVPDHMITVGIKHIKFWKQAGGGFTSKRGIFGKVGPSTSMMCVAFDKDKDKAHSGGANGLVYHWTGNQLTGTVNAHHGPVFAMLAVEKGFITGGKDGKVALWDEQFEHCLKTYQLHSSAVVTGGGAQMHTDLPAVRALSLGQNKILVGTKTSEILEIDKNGPIRLLIQGHMEGELWGLAMHPFQLMCTTVSDDCTLCVWDLSTNRMLVSAVLMKPARCCCYSSDGKAIAVGMKDGSFVVLDTESLEEIVGYSHRKEEISDIKFSPAPSCKYLAVASHENYVDIYNVTTYKRVGICKGASSYITHVDWDTRGKLLRVNTGDGDVLYFEAPRGRQQYVTKEAAADIEWASWTCVLGSECQGVWPPGSDITDVNTAHVIQDGSTIATGDDFGFVKLFSFPSKGRHAKFKEYVGHSAHVTNVRWTHDSSQLVSIGGADMSMIVWRRDGATDQVSLNVDDTDSDSEEEGYDSDVEREKRINYISKTYMSPIRDSSVVKPYMKQQPQADTGKKPAVSRSSKAVSLVKTLPAVKPIHELRLEFIFGYRGFDTRQNVFFTADGEVAYHAAGAGIIYNPLTRRQSFYLEHNDDIVCLALSSNPKLKHVCATGQIGKNAPVHIWDLSSKQTLSVLQGHHTVGICSVNFSFSGKLLLTVGLDNSIAVWRWTEGIKMADSGCGSRRIFLAQFRPDSDVQFVSVGVGHVKFWTLAGSQVIGKDPIFPKSVSAKMQTMLSIAFAPEGITYTGSVRGMIYAWTGNILSRVITDAHTGPIFAMCTSLEDGLIVSGGKETSGSDSIVKLWDQEVKRCNSFTLSKPSIVRSVSRAKGKIVIGTQDSEVLILTEKGSTCEVLAQGHKEGELWGLTVHPSANLFVTASDDKTVRTWSLDTKELKCEYNLSQPGRSVDFSPDGETIAVGQANGEFLLLAASDLSLAARRRDRNNTIQCIRFSPSGDRLAVGSDNSCVDIYTVTDLSKGITRTSYCHGIPSGVTHMDWSSCGQYLQISTSSYDKLIYDSRSGRQVPSSSKLGNIIWDTWTSILGAEVVGIWPRNADKADVNTACVAHGGNIVATGDDFGVVKLFDHFPVSGKFASSKSYYGHSAHVTSVRFTHNDEYLLSAGGDDSCVFVWKTR